MTPPRWWPTARTRHRLLLWLWTALLVPSLLWWRDAVWWVVTMSHYANLASEAAAAQAAELSPTDVRRIAEEVADVLEARRLVTLPPSTLASTAGQGALPLCPPESGADC